MDMIKILIADPHPLVRKMLKETLGRESDMTVICEAENTYQVMDGVKSRAPDIVLTSLSLPGRGSLKMIRDLKRLFPNLPVLVLTMHPEELFAAESIRSGASGYLTKDVPPDEILSAVRDLISGKEYASGSIGETPGVTKQGGKRTRSPHHILSRREFQIMSALAAGKESSVIAEELNVTIRTVSSHLYSIMRKMKINSLPELRHYAEENKLTEM